MLKSEIILENIKMNKLLEKLHIEPKRNKYLCPFHNDKHPSASIYQNKWFHCFSCGINYNVIDFMAHYKKISRKLAMEEINNMFCLWENNNLTKEEENEYKKANEKYKKQQEIKLKNIKFEKNITNQIIFELHKWEDIEKITHITRGDYKSGNWELGNLYFIALKKIRWLNWLYDIICGFETKDIIYNYLIGNQKSNILNKLKNGDIEIDEWAKL